MIQPLDNNVEFKEEFKKTLLKILLNPIDQLIAALVIFDRGTVDVEEYKKFDKLMEMNKKQIGYDALLQFSTKTLGQLASGKLSTFQLLRAARKDKNIILKGKLKLIKLGKALALLAKRKK